MWHLWSDNMSASSRRSQVDCTAEMELCRQHYIQGFPSIRVFRKGHDDIYIGGMHEHESYMGGYPTCRTPVPRPHTPWPCEPTPAI